MQWRLAGCEFESATSLHVTGKTRLVHLHYFKADQQKKVVNAEIGTVDFQNEMPNTATKSNWMVGTLENEIADGIFRIRPPIPVRVTWKPGIVLLRYLKAVNRKMKIGFDNPNWFKRNCRSTEHAQMFFCCFLNSRISYLILVLILFSSTNDFGFHKYGSWINRNAKSSIDRQYMHICSSFFSRCFYFKNILITERRYFFRDPQIRKHLLRHCLTSRPTVPNRFASLIQLILFHLFHHLFHRFRRLRPHCSSGRFQGVLGLCLTETGTDK